MESLSYDHKHLVVWEDGTCNALIFLLFLAVDPPTITLLSNSDQTFAGGYHEGLLVLLCGGLGIGGEHKVLFIIAMSVELFIKLKCFE